MDKQKLLILDKERIGWKLRRMAYEIWEHNSEAKELTFLGIEQGGMVLANNLKQLVEEIGPVKVNVLPLVMNKRAPLQDLPTIKDPLDDRSIVLVDDVANSGKTLLYALKPILDHSPAKVLIAVLVDRKHKSFPISPDIVGHTVSTTLQEHIEVEHDGKNISAAYLM